MKRTRISITSYDDDLRHPRQRTRRQESQGILPDIDRLFGDVSAMMRGSTSNNNILDNFMGVAHLLTSLPGERYSGEREERQQKHASKHVIESLKRIPFTQEDNDGESNCMICLETLKKGISPSCKNNIRLKCNHVAHDECIIRWLEIKNTCPVCRLEIK